LTDLDEIDPRTTALLIVDYVRFVFEHHFHGDPAGLFSAATAVLEAARQAGMLVVFVRPGFRDGYPEVSNRNKFAVALRESGSLLLSSPEVEIDPRVQPRPEEPIVTKHRRSVFPGTDIEQILRSRKVDSLILAGIATGGAVLSTLCDAADRDYRLFVLRDACSDTDEEVHRFLLDKFFPRRGQVASSMEVVEAIKRASKSRNP